MEKHSFEAYVPDSESARAEFAQAASRYRPQIYELSQKNTLNDDYFVDDHLLSVSTSELKLGKFLRQGLSSETRTDLHRVVFWFCAATILLGLGFYQGVVVADHK